MELSGCEQLSCFAVRLQRVVRWLIILLFFWKWITTTASRIYLPFKQEIFFKYFLSMSFPRGHAPSGKNSMNLIRLTCITKPFLECGPILKVVLTHCFYSLSYHLTIELSCRIRAQLLSCRLQRFVRSLIQLDVGYIRITIPWPGCTCFHVYTSSDITNAPSAIVLQRIPNGQGGMLRGLPFPSTQTTALRVSPSLKI